MLKFKKKIALKINIAAFVTDIRYVLSQMVYHALGH